MSVVSELNNIRKQTYNKRGKSYFGDYKTIDEYDKIISECKEQRDKINIGELNYQLSQCNNKIKEIDSELYHLLFVLEDTEEQEKTLHNQRKQIIDEKIDLSKQIDEYKGIDRIINNAYNEKQFVIEVHKKLDEMKPLIELKYNEPNEYIIKNTADLFDRYITDLNDIVLEILSESSQKYAKSMTDYIKRHLNITPLNKFVSNLKSLSNTYINSCVFNKENLNKIVNKISNNINTHWNEHFIAKFEDILDCFLVVSSDITNIKDANKISSCFVQVIKNHFDENGKFYNLFHQYIDDYKMMLEEILNEYIDKNMLNDKLAELVPKSNNIDKFIKSLPTDYSPIEELIALYQKIVGEDITNRDIGKLLKSIDGIEYKRKKINNKLVSTYRYCQ